ncbi:DUF6884 domain-containing protein [Halosimplex sp. TS25]|uniref:DUF6884 domain-containing protein n=1 Tax=Halosimplex rarum TaxID=3396619 RepID=UPI0039EB173F
MRFYVPEWDDAVDAGYDFEHDELSTLHRQERDLDYIWDIFEKDETPIDGVLISREQVESTKRKSKRLAEHGVYDDPILSIPDWLPTISDCGAWGYKSFPFPPYGNAEMLDFYETLEVTVGVTIDHLVLGSGKEKGRLYLDERAFQNGFKKSDIPDEITDAVDLMIDEWPAEWPSYVAEYEPSICTGPATDVSALTPEDFEGSVEAVLQRFADDPRAVYRQDDKQFRYDLTLQNAREIRELYEQGDYPFRLMVAIQGWKPEKYVQATEAVLDLGYDYVGIGGVAGSPIHEVRKIVKDVGKAVKHYERTHETRVDTHVFGFAKSEAFETIGRSGMASFDSASMLRSAWTGGQNYRLDADERYDAIRVRYPSHGADIEDAVETALRGRETLEALRAYANGEPIAEALREWEQAADETLTAAEEYLREHRHDEQFDATRLRDVESRLREDFPAARKLRAYFSEDLRDQIVKYLRSDGPDDPLPFEDYASLLRTAEETFQRFPRLASVLEVDAQNPAGMDRFERIWFVLQDYASWIGDEDLLEAYQQTLANRPWERCDCPICEEHGIEVCLFRGNDRNRRRGFHNTDRFYDEFSKSLPKTLVVTKGTASLGGYETVEAYLKSEKPKFWDATHDLPVAELGVVDASGIHEWWEETPSSVSFAPGKMADTLEASLSRYDRLYVHDPDAFFEATERSLQEAVDEVQTHRHGEQLRESVLADLGESYSVGRDFLPHPPVLESDDGLDILVIDQCSGSKYVPDGATIFGVDELENRSREELLGSENVRGIEAKDLYTGRQQESVTDAVRRLKADGHNVERYFISAGFGLVEESEQLPPYEVTFSDMSVGEIRDRSERLNLKSDLSKVLAQADYDIVFFTMGKDYYTSIDIDTAIQQVPPDRIGVVFNRDLVDDQFENIVSVPARTEDAKRHGTIVIGLKGLYLENFAENLSEVDALDPETIRALCRHVDEEPIQAGIENF